MTLKIAMIPARWDSQPQQSAELGVRLAARSVEGFKGETKELVLIRPAANLLAASDAIGPEAKFWQMFCGLSLRLGDGTRKGGSGQLLITEQRFIGMLDQAVGDDGKPKEMDPPGAAYCFTFLRSDVYEPEVEKKRLKPSDFTFRSKEEQAISFRLTVFAAYASVSKDKLHYWHDKDTFRALST